MRTKGIYSGDLGDEYGAYFTYCLERYRLSRRGRILAWLYPHVTECRAGTWTLSHRCFTYEQTFPLKSKMQVDIKHPVITGGPEILNTSKTQAELNRAFSFQADHPLPRCSRVVRSTRPSVGVEGSIYTIETTSGSTFPLRISR